MSVRPGTFAGATGRGVQLVVQLVGSESGLLKAAIRKSFPSKKANAQERKASAEKEQKEKKRKGLGLSDNCSSPRIQL